MLLAAALAGAAPAAASPETPVHAFQDVLIEAMKAGRSLDFDGRYALIAPVVDAAFDLPAIARAVMGGHAESLDPAMRDRLAALLRKYAITSLAARFTEHDGERFVIDAASALDSGAHRVRALFERGAEAPVRLDYLVREIEGAWRIANVWFEGVSQTKIQRDEFAAFLRDGRAEELAARLEDRVGDIAGR